ncbi:MAG: site-2 protease family protein [Proteobacteria bacterium]|nr:site-2 protease family protein [Pseudomonadota bacterium]
MLGELMSHPVLVIVFTLGILVFIHELGHFLVGKYFGMGVISFSIGFGPAIFAYTHKKTVYRLGCIPLGGYVQFAGASSQDNVHPDFVGMEMHAKPLWQRALVLLAGPLANLLLAFVLFTWIAYEGESVRSAVVGMVESGSPADQAGLHVGDEIINIGTQPIRYWYEISTALDEQDTTPLSIAVKRDGKELELHVTPSQDDGTKRIGIIASYLPAMIRVTSGSQADAVGLKSATALKAVGFSVHTQDPTDDVDYHNVKVFHDLLRHFQTHLLPLLNKHGEDASYGLHFQSSDHPNVTLIISGKDSMDVIRDQHQNNHNPYNALLHLLNSLGIYSPELMVVSVDQKKQTTGYEDESESEKKNKGIKVVDNIMPGDIITHIADKAIDDTFSYIRQSLAHLKEETTSVSIRRSDQLLRFDVQKTGTIVQREEGAVMHYNWPFSLPSLVGGGLILKREETVWKALASGLTTTYESSYAVVDALVGLVTARVSMKSLGGPILIAGVASDAASQGLMRYLQILALISINLFLINLFPIPILDGGQLVLVTLEGIKGSRLSRQFVENYQKIGFVMVLSLIVLATYNDISRYWLSMLQALGMG